MHRPEIYISATPGELDAYRSIVRLTLKQMGAQPVELEDLNVEYGPLQGVLNQLIGRCEAVIHLAGNRYGPEPAERTLHAPKRSFSHYEVDVAHSLKKPFYAFLTTPETPTPAQPEEPFELKQLQQDQRRALQNSGEHCEVFSDSETLASLVRDLRLKLMARRRFARLPHAPLGNRFIGRQQLMVRLRQDVQTPGIVVLHPPEGLDRGGTGRTAVAVELAWTLHEENVFPFVFTLPGGSRAELEVALAALARSDGLGLLPDEVSGHRARLQAVLNWFRSPEQAGKWLIIVDDVDSAATWARLAVFLPELGSGPILVTSRLRFWPDIRAHSVGAFSADQAREFLLMKRGTSEPPVRNELAALERLGEGMGRVPLTLEVAAGHLRESQLTAMQVLSECLSNPSDSPFIHPPPTASQILERSAAKLDPIGRALLAQLTAFAPQPAAIPVTLFEQRGDWPELRERLAVLESRALVARDEPGRSVSVHRAIREMFVGLMSKEERNAALGAALATVDAALRRSSSVGGKTREQLVPHCIHILGQLNGHPLEIHAFKLAQTFAEWLQDAGRPAEAESFFRRALQIEEKRLGPEHPEMAARIRDLASVLRLRGRLKESEALARRALTLTEKAFGPDHHEVVGDLFLVAGALRANDSLAEAEEMLRRALRIEERLVGPMHPRTGIAVQRLAGLLEIRGQIPEAEQLYRRCLTIEEKTFAENHPRIAISLANLAGLLTRTGRAGEAVGLAQRALQIDQKTYGKEHPEYVSGQKQYAWILEEVGRVNEAAKLQRSILERDRELLGEDHPEVGVDALTFGCLRLEQGHPDEGEEYAEMALRIFAAQDRKARGVY
ncbi:MAG: tetratricopeptide repeat protein, partial [Chthoniobacteraceae bacterium]